MEKLHSSLRRGVPAATPICQAQPAEHTARTRALLTSRGPLALLAIGAFLLAGAAWPEVLGDILIDKRSSLNGVPAVVFPHWKHRTLFRCYACHPDPFEMEAGANDIQMSAIQAGQFCGRCHNGEVAFEVGFNTCRQCHSQVGP